MEFKKRKTKEIKQSILMAAFIIDEGVDGYGKKFIKTRWVEIKEPLNLGSLIKPSKEIYLIKYFVPPK